MQEFLARYLFHWSPERAIWLGGHTLSWDARCAGIYAGFGITLVFFLLDQRHSKAPLRTTMTAAALLSLPMLLDVATVHYQIRLPHNSLRHLTGLLFGIAFCCLLFPAVRHLATGSILPEQSHFKTLVITIVLGSAISSLTHLNHPASFYLLETLSWLGFSGLSLLISSGLYLVFVANR